MFSARTPTSRRTVVVALMPLALALLIAGCSSSPATSPGNDAPAGRAAPAAPTASVDAVLPAAQAYVDAVNAADLDALVAAFAPDGEVVDVARHIRSPDAIRTWAGNEVIGGTLRVDAVTAVSADTQRLRVQWKPSGSDGWAADYTFITSGDQILVADLQYAR